MSEILSLDAQTPIHEVPLKFEEGLPLRVVVTDAEGHPKSGVRLSLHFEAKPHHGFSGGPHTTDRDGVFVFEHVNPRADGEYAVSVAAGGDYPGRSVPVKIDGQPIAIALPRGLTLKGQVLDDRTGKPLAKVKVQAHPRYDQSSVSRAEAETWTDDSGRFEFANLDDGNYWLDVDRTMAAGTIITQTATGTQYTHPSNWQIEARGGQQDAVTLRVIPQ
jgi:5-hydroxyisourate hydrolase-like protein (transthyretin family)